MLARRTAGVAQPEGGIEVLVKLLGFPFHSSRQRPFERTRCASAVRDGWKRPGWTIRFYAIPAIPWFDLWSTAVVSPNCRLRHLEAEVEASLQRICEALSLSSDAPVGTAKPVAVQPVKLTPMSRGLKFKKQHKSDKLS